MRHFHYKRRRGFTVWELVCIIGVIALLFALLMPALSKVKRVSTRVVCGTNLKGLGTAMAVYANDYGGWYPQLPGTGRWSRLLGFDYHMERPDLTPGGAQGSTGRTITASWYLLVRETDVSPKSLICPETRQEAFGGRYLVYNKDVTEMWDFGAEPYKHVSYAMHLPYGRFPANANRSAAFALAADMSPWFVNGDIVPPGQNGEAPQLALDDYRSSSLSYGPGRRAANSSNHGGGKGWGGEGQNVLFADGHSSYQQRPDVGIARDGIYTYWPTDAPNEDDRRTGKNPATRDEDNDARSAEDSFLAI